MKNNQSGFTLAELLIVVAIIAVLTAIAIPVFNIQLEKSREAVDVANIRGAYAEAAVLALEETFNNPIEIKITQKKPGWIITPGKIGGIDLSSVEGFDTVKAGDSVWVCADKDSGEVQLYATEPQ